VRGEPAASAGAGRRGDVYAPSAQSESLPSDEGRRVGVELLDPEPFGEYRSLAANPADIQRQTCHDAYGTRNLVTSRRESVSCPHTGPTQGTGEGMCRRDTH